MMKNWKHLWSLMIKPTAAALAVSLLAAGPAFAQIPGSGTGKSASLYGFPTPADESTSVYGLSAAAEKSVTEGQLFYAEEEETLSEEEKEHESEWVSFMLICNEGMSNQGGNSGNTMMIVSMHPTTGKIRLMMYTWDSFIQYEGYDVPQKLDMPYRNNGPEETVKVFNENFNLGIENFLSLNYLNLASLIDNYNGVNVDVSRAERNALNGMVAAKKENLLASASTGLLSQMVIEMLADDYYLSEYGPATHLRGLQAVGFGWLQYDSVYNCCLREINVIGSLFASMGTTISEKIVFYTNESGEPDEADAIGKRLINLDDITDEDREFLRMEMAPIFQMSYNNLKEEDILDISMAMVKAAYDASRQGVDIMESLDYAIFPLEAKDPYDTVAGMQGHLVDYEKNSMEMQKFLYGAED